MSGYTYRDYFMPGELGEAAYVGLEILYSIDTILRMKIKVN